MLKKYNPNFNSFDFKTVIPAGDTQLVPEGSHPKERSFSELTGNQRKKTTPRVSSKPIQDKN